MEHSLAERESPLQSDAPPLVRYSPIDLYKAYSDVLLIPPIDDLNNGSGVNVLRFVAHSNEEQLVVQGIIPNKPGPHGVDEEMGILDQFGELWRFDEYRTDFEEAFDAVSEDQWPSSQPNLSSTQCLPILLLELKVRVLARFHPHHHIVSALLL